LYQAAKWILGICKHIFDNCGGILIAHHRLIFFLRRNKTFFAPGSLNNILVVSGSPVILHGNIEPALFVSIPIVFPSFSLGECFIGESSFDFADNTLRIIEVDTTEEWAVEGNQIVTDAAAPLDVVYIERVTDPTLFDAKFTEALALRLAADIAYDITASQTVATRAEQKYMVLIKEARLIDGQESLSANEQTWLEARA